ncbi:MAG: T9SS type A sorting domain-containing protein, partial [Flavisolibacter sp.]
DVRRKSVYTTYSSLIQLRFHPWYKDAFITGSISQSLNGAVKWIKVSSGDTSHLLVVGNFDVNGQTASISFPTAGTWYDYLNNTTFSSTGTAQSINLQPGEFHVFVNRNVNNVMATPVIDVPWNEATLEVKAYPNPINTDFTLEVKLPQSSKVTADLYNSLGQYVETLYDAFLIKGAHPLPVKKPKLSKGIYYLKLNTKSTTKTISVTIQ